MVGGVIIGLSETAKCVHVHVAHCPHYPKHDSGNECPNPDTCCVYTDAKREDGNGVLLEVGDSLWWQGNYCFWTPKANRGRPNNRGGVDYDIRLQKIGFSH